MSESEDLRKIFFSGIDTSVTEEEFKEFVEEKVGAENIQETKLVKKENAKACIAFVTVTKVKTVDDFLLTKEGIKLKDKEITIKRAVPKNFNHESAHEKTKKLFVANLPKKGFSDEDLKAFILENTTNPDFGVIESVQLVKEKDDKGNPTEDSKGFGFVEVSSEDYCDKLAIELMNFEVQGRKAEMKKSLPSRGGGRGRGRGGAGNPRGGRGGAAPYGGYQQYYAPYDPYGYGGGFDQYGYGGGYGGYAGSWGGPAAPRGRGRYQPY